MLKVSPGNPGLMTYHERTIQEKRNSFIGVKVDPDTRAKIEYIAQADGSPLSTYIYDLIRQHVELYSRMTHIDWSEEFR